MATKSRETVRIREFTKISLIWEMSVHRIGREASRVYDEISGQVEATR
jgi:hypothetical protein